MLIELTHPQDGYEFWIESTEIIAMERKAKPKTTLLTLDESPEVTALVLKSGRIFSCKETPKQVIDIINNTETVFGLTVLENMKGNS